MIIILQVLHLLNEFDDYLYRLADGVWPHALALTEKDYPPYDKCWMPKPTYGCPRKKGFGITGHIWNPLDYHQLCS